VTTEHQPSPSKEAKVFQRIEIRASAEQRAAVYDSVLNSSRVGPEYVALLTLAGLIALFGLLENSAAVIIGAMLISPLMSPILSAGLALLLGDGKLGKRSAVVLAFSIAGVIGITWLVAYLIPLKQATPEILARTAPNLLDLFIAVLSGLAGTLALRGGSVTMTILPGVAIAVAVVPPLSVIGYGLSTRQWSIAGGAFLLFVTNLVSIIISAAVVFRIMGFHPRREAEQGRWKLKYRVGVSALVLIFLSIPLLLTLRKAAIQVSIRSQLQRNLNFAFEKNKVSVADLSFSQVQDGLLIQATLQTPLYLEANVIQSTEETLRKRYGQGTKLMVNQILVTRGGVTPVAIPRAQNPISGGVVKSEEEKPAFDFNGSRLKSQEFVQNELDGVLAGTEVQQVAAPEIVLTSALNLTLHLRLISPEILSSQTIPLLASQLGSKLGVPVDLHGQVELKGPSFQLTLTPAKPSMSLGSDDRAELGKIAKRVQEDKLRLSVTFTPDQSVADDKATPHFVSDVRRFLSMSGLKNSQWTITVESPNGSESRTAGNSTPAPVEENDRRAIAANRFHCDFKSFQDF
jgi:uncharacterized hydrophobic protein (TIGR00271 family)